jgi:hypothetical protein
MNLITRHKARRHFTGKFSEVDKSRKCLDKKGKDENSFVGDAH